ncbi:hypothetical protein ABHF33_07165 [Chitinibacter sp. FCG-7]|uniref:Phage integrase SAM-like domain-containing protein n=1 Tax=Chitinibacter mangrovi TaxID=3153927 RepID=A0AAU7FE61_9NEIS
MGRRSTKDILDKLKYPKPCGLEVRNPVGDKMVEDSTLYDYYIKGCQIIRKASKQMGYPDGEIAKPMEIAKWFDDYRVNISSNLFRTMKQRILMVIYFLCENKSFTDCEEAIKTIKACTSTGVIRNTKKVLAKKDLDKIMAKFNEEIRIRTVKDYKTKDRIILLRDSFLASLLTGLRPCEWYDAELNDEKNQLIVLNAKEDENREGGKYRVLNLEDFTEEEGDLVSRVCKNFDKIRRAKVRLMLFNKIKLEIIKEKEEQGIDCKKISKDTMNAWANSRYEEFRHMLQQLSSKELEDLTEFEMNIFNEYLDIEKKARDNLSMSMSRDMGKISRDALGFRESYPVRYSARHQFKINQKKAGYCKNVRAALMGNASNEAEGVSDFRLPSLAK